MHDKRMKYNTVQIEAKHNEHDRPTRACEVNKQMPLIEVIFCERQTDCFA